MRTANPALSERVFREATAAPASKGRMSAAGTSSKTLFLVLLVLCTAVFSWEQSFQDTYDHQSISPTPYLWIGLIGGLVAALVTIFAKKLSPFTAPAYALFEGLLIGGVSASFEYRYPGIALQASLATLGTLVAMLVAYRMQIIRATERFRWGVVAATGGIALVYMISFIASFFGVTIPYIHDGGPIGIGISALIVTVAALNLILDFDFIERGEKAKLPRYMEWYAAFGLLVTLIWLYLEMLRLLAKSRRK